MMMVYWSQDIDDDDDYPLDNIQAILWTEYRKKEIGDWRLQGGLPADRRSLVIISPCFEDCNAKDVVTTVATVAFVPTAMIKD